MASPSLFGFETFQKLYEPQIEKKTDVIILFVHWYLVKSGFKCIGLGDSKVFDPSTSGSELLPVGWSSNINYTIRYVHDGKLYIFHGIKSDDDILLNLLSIENNSVSNTQFPIGQTVKELRGSIESIIPSYETVLHRIRTDLVSPLATNLIERSVQTQDSPSTGPGVARPVDPDPLRVGVPQTGPRQPWRPEDPPIIGRGDLDPFARGGGMLFDPFHPGQRGPFAPARPGIGMPGRLPPGAVPPGARFDPFGPPDVDPPRPRPNPDRDLARLPDYDDMFM